MKTIVFDIDETICYSQDISYDKATPIESMVKLVNNLYDKGHTIYLHTGRHMQQEKVTREWLEENRVKYHAIFYGKPVGDYYIDDKAVKYSGDSKKVLAAIGEMNSDNSSGETWIFNMEN